MSGAIAATSGVLVDIVAPGFGFPASVAVQATINFVGQQVERRRRQAVAVVDEASRLGGITVAEFLTRAHADPPRSELTMRALAASAATYMEEKIHVLGRALANGVLAADDAILDTELFVVDAFSRLEAPHVPDLYPFTHVSGSEARTRRTPARSRRSPSGVPRCGS